MPTVSGTLTDSIMAGRRSPRSPVSERDAWSDLGAGSTYGDHHATVLPSQQVVVDHPGDARVLHLPDGTVVWEPVKPERSPNRLALVLDHMRSSAIHMVKGSLTASLLVGGAVAVISTNRELKKASQLGYCITDRELSRVVRGNVTSTVSGMITGIALGPVAAAATLAKKLSRGCVVGVAIWKGAVWLRNRKGNLEVIMRALQSGVLGQQLEALQQIVLKAFQNSRFCKRFQEFGGIDLLISLLKNNLPDSPLVQKVIEALTHLTQEPSCQDALVSANGVAALTALLTAGPSKVVQGSLVVLESVACYQPAKTSLLSTGTIAAIIGVLSDHQQGQEVHLCAARVLQSLTLDPAFKTAVAGAHGVPVLLHAVTEAPLKSQLQVYAASALHNAVRGNHENAEELAHLPESHDSLARVLGQYGPSTCWHPAKVDLTALVNVIVCRNAIAARQSVVLNE